TEKRLESLSWPLWQRVQRESSMQKLQRHYGEQDRSPNPATAHSGSRPIGIRSQRCAPRCTRFPRGRLRNPATCAFAKPSAIPPCKTPTTGVDDFCACAVSGHAAADPAITLMKSRRRIAFPKAGTAPIRTRLQQGVPYCCKANGLVCPAGVKTPFVRK